MTTTQAPRRRWKLTRRGQDVAFMVGLALSLAVVDLFAWLAWPA